MAKLFRIEDRQEMDGQSLENVYWYICSNANPTSLQVAIAFNTQVVAPLRLLQSNQLTHKSLKVEEVIAGGDSIDAVQTGNNTGSKGGDYLPIFNSFGFSLPPANSVIRDGSKRYAGIIESDTNAGDMVTAFKTALGVFSLQVVANIIIPSVSATLVPVIVRKLGNPVTSYLVSQIIGAVVSQLGTQNTRKRNHGGGVNMLLDSLYSVHYNDNDSVSEGLSPNDTIIDDSYTATEVFPTLNLAQVNVIPPTPNILS